MKTPAKSPAASPNDGHSVAFDRRVDQELCRDLAVRYTKGMKDRDEAANVRMRLQAIAEELRCLQAAEVRECDDAETTALMEEVLRNGADGEAQTRFLVAWMAKTEPTKFPEPPYCRVRKQMATVARQKRAFERMERVIRGFLAAKVRGEEFAPRVSGPNGKLKRRLFTGELLSLCALEWLRDAKTLRAFLAAVFSRWRKIDEPDSAWRRSLVIHQTEPSWRDEQKPQFRVLAELQRLGVYPKEMKGKQLDAAIEQIRQMLYRDARKARA